MSPSNEQDREYENLNDAILKAIVSSRDVKKVLLDFKSKNLINNLAVLNLILSLEELSDLIFGSNEGKGLYKLEPVDNAGNVSGSCQAGTGHHPKYTIDGRPLTHNEIMFESFCQEKFDELKWLRKARLKL
ncbi:MAG: hypothetical protein COV67_14040 [Nitrospinae bacterium CG11_big_fil_rev_8_21_14_0_20_56_8]|nr:MAG: hypothetical protein COV67_14040 [Nitrospinae bacterium CG11_big_fil_rev_8_21_14_0_20_56_8]